MWAVFKVFVEFVTILLMVLLFGHEAGTILAPWPGIDPASSALESYVLTTGLPGKSLLLILLILPLNFTFLNISEN